MGSRESFSCSSSMRLIFHFSRFTCQVPSANVKIGTMPSRIIVGLSRESFFALYVGVPAVVDSVRLQYDVWGFLSNCRLHVAAEEKIPRRSLVQLNIAG